MAAQRYTRDDVERALGRLIRIGGIPNTAGMSIDCYAPDGRKMCVVVDGNGHRPFGQQRRTLRELHDCFDFALSVIEHTRQYQ